jgi:hypothetical protein
MPVQNKSLPSWLPAFVEMRNWETYLASLVNLFEEDWKKAPPQFQRLHVRYDHVKNTFQVPEGIWKVISQKSPNTGQRIFDPIRGERILWIRAIIEAYAKGEAEVLHYTQTTKNSKNRSVVRDILFLDIENYCHEIILERKNTGYYYLVSSFQISEGCRKWKTYSRRSP